MPTAVIVDAVRTPIGKFGGALAPFTAADLGAHVIRALLERSPAVAGNLDEVVIGQVMQGGAGMNVARTAALRAGLPNSVCAWTVNKACASGMQAIELARQGILLGNGSAYIAGGTESMSNVPHYVRDLRWGHKLGNVDLVDGIMADGLTCAISGLGMGLTAEEIVKRTGITRAEMDAWALRSQERALIAVAGKRFADEIIPVPRRKDEPFAADEYPRATSLEALAALRPAFTPEGCVTAGNSSGLNDGAAAVLVMDSGRAAELALTPRATIVDTASAGVEPEVMGLGPVDAVRKLCAKMNVSPRDFQLVELNEAFAVQAVAVTRELDLDEERVNVNGSGISLGHPLGATGARIVVSLLHEMEKRDLQLGLATLCIGGGMGMAMALAR